MFLLLLFFHFVHFTKFSSKNSNLYRERITPVLIWLYCTGFQGRKIKVIFLVALKHLHVEISLLHKHNMCQ